MPVNVTVEDLGPCKKQLRFELDLQEVHEAFESVTKDFQRHAAMPGFRPGKAPPEMVSKKYEKEIAEEAQNKLRSDSYKNAIKDKELHPIHITDLEEVQFGRDGYASVNLIQNAFFGDE